MKNKQTNHHTSNLNNYLLCIKNYPMVLLGHYTIMRLQFTFLSYHLLFSCFFMLLLNDSFIPPKQPINSQSFIVLLIVIFTMNGLSIIKTYIIYLFVLLLLISFKRSIINIKYKSDYSHYHSKPPPYMGHKCTIVT